VKQSGEGTGTGTGKGKGKGIGKVVPMCFQMSTTE
jgi:hypothetical protein